MSGHQWGQLPYIINNIIPSYILLSNIMQNCDNHFMPEAKTPETEGHLVIGFEAAKGHENKMFVDDREKQR